MIKKILGIVMILIVFIIMSIDSLFKNAKEIDVTSDGININIHHSGRILER